MTHFTLDTQHPVIIPCGTIHVDGLIHVPQDAKSIVLFVHGSGSSRFSVRNQQVAQVLNEKKLATLLFDLLTPEEEALDKRTSELRFDIEFLSSRLIRVTDWCLHHPIFKNLALGYFGASTGAAAALVAAAEIKQIKAIVSRGGRPDLAGPALPLVKAPILLIVGGDDLPVIDMNKAAMKKMTSIKEIKIVPGATHLFEEPGTLEQVANLAQAWFCKYLMK